MLATVVVLIPLINGVNSSTHDRVCDNESHIKLSILKGLQENRMVKANRMHEFEKEMEEAEKEVEKAKLKVSNLQALINKTKIDGDKLTEEVENMTIMGILELEEQQICPADIYICNGLLSGKFICIIYLYYVLKEFVYYFADKDDGSISFLWDILHQGPLFRRPAIQ